MIKNQKIYEMFAEREGFEPPVTVNATTVFKTAAFDRSAISLNKSIENN